MEFVKECAKIIRKCMGFLVTCDEAKSPVHFLLYFQTPLYISVVISNM